MRATYDKIRYGIPTVELNLPHGIGNRKKTRKRTENKKTLCLEDTVRTIVRGGSPEGRYIRSVHDNRWLLLLEN